MPKYTNAEITKITDSFIATVKNVNSKLDKIKKILLDEKNRSWVSRFPEQSKNYRFYKKKAESAGQEFLAEAGVLKQKKSELQNDEYQNRYLEIIGKAKLEFELIQNSLTALDTLIASKIQQIAIEKHKQIFLFATQLLTTIAAKISQARKIERLTQEYHAFPRKTPMRQQKDTQSLTKTPGPVLFHFAP